jgi:hypothetical protein
VAATVGAETAAVEPFPTLINVRPTAVDAKTTPATPAVSQVYTISPEYVSKTSVVSTNGTTATIQFFGSLIGEIKLVFSEGFNVTAPSGWTKLDGNDAGTILWRRVEADGTETCAITGLVTGVHRKHFGVTFSGCVASGNPIEAYSINYQAVNLSATATATSITALTDNTMLFLAIGGYDYDVNGWNEANFSYGSPLAGIVTTEINKVEGDLSDSARWNVGVAGWYDKKAAAGSTGDCTIPVTAVKSGGYVTSFLLALTGH